MSPFIAQPRGPAAPAPPLGGGPPGPALPASAFPPAPPISGPVPPNPKSPVPPAPAWPLGARSEPESRQPVADTTDARSMLLTRRDEFTWVLLLIRCQWPTFAVTTDGTGWLIECQRSSNDPFAGVLRQATCPTPTVNVAIRSACTGVALT